MKKIKEIENKFDEFFPLSTFSTENYQGKAEELEVTRWQDSQTKSALARSNRIKEFISSSISLLLEEIEKDLPRMYSNKELMLKSGTNDYYWMKSKNDTLEEVIKIIIKRY